MAERSNFYLDIPSGSSLVRAGSREATKLVDFVWTFSPALLGGLVVKRVYSWGVQYIESDKGSWTITKTDEGAGATAVLIFAFLVWRVAGESDMVSMFVAGVVGRGSIVVRNTFYRILGWNPPANAPEADYIDVTPVEPGSHAAPNEPQAGLDDEMLREIGRYGLNNAEFRTAMADGLGRRVNEWLGTQGRPPVDGEAIQNGVRDIFASMASRG